MHTTTTTLDVLYVTTEAADGTAVADQLGFDKDSLRLSVAASVDDAAERLESGQFDCLLCADEDGECLGLVRMFHGEFPSLPVVVFAAEATPGYVNELLRAGAADVVQSALESTPPSLVLSRLRNVVGTPAVQTVRQEMLERYETILNAAGDAIYQLDPEGNVVAVNDATVELTGYRRSELIGEHVSLLMDEDDIETGTELLRDQLREDGTRVDTLEMDLHTRDGRTVPCETRIATVTVEGELAGSVGVVRDVSERNRIRSELEAERDMFAEGPVVVFRWRNESDWPVEYVTDNVEGLFGYTRDQFESGEVSYADVVHETDLDRIAEEVESNSDGTTERFEHEPYRIVTADGEVRWVKDTTKIIQDDGEITHYLGYVVDITERKAHEEQIADQRDALERLDRINGIIRDIDQALVRATTRGEIEQAVCERLTEAGRYGFALALRLRGDDTFVPHAWTEDSEAFVEETFPIDASDPETSPGRRALEREEVEVFRSLQDDQDAPSWHSDARAAGVESLAAIPITYEGTEYGVIAVYADEAVRFTERELEVLGELGETIGYAIAAVERREREEMLTRLYEATQDLLGAETEQAVCDVVVDAAADVLGLPGVGIFLFDDEENVLEPAAATEPLLEYYGEPTTFGPGHEDSITWQTYVTGETRTFADVRTADQVSNPDTDARSVIVVPLGDHGVFVASSPDPGSLDDRIQQLVGLLAATTEAALDRVAGRADIRERDRVLADRTARLELIEQVLEALRDVESLLIGAGTRDEIERQLCERLTEMSPYDFAWIGTVPPDSDTVEPRTWTGSEDGYLDEVSFDVGGAEPAARTAETGKITVVSNVADHLREAAWARTAIDHDFQSVAAVPLVYGETTYGVLVVYATAANGFREPVSSVLGEMGELAAYSINNVETRRGILAERVTELELRIHEPKTFLNAVARVTGESVSYREILPEERGTARVLFALSDPPVEDVLALEEEFVAVDSLTHVTAGDEHLFRATVGGETVAATLLQCGGLPRDVVADADETNVAVHIPQELDVRVFLERVRESYPDTELVSRRDVERQSRVRSDVREALEEKLTDRQREVLITAYNSGFFESPRETTGAELATLLGISQPTLTHHLREAQRRLFEVLYEGST